jgi:hypothetical protein
MEFWSTGVLRIAGLHPASAGLTLLSGDFLPNEKSGVKTPGLSPVIPSGLKIRQRLYETSLRQNTAPPKFAICYLLFAILTPLKRQRVSSAPSPSLEQSAQNCAHPG